MTKKAARKMIGEDLGYVYAQGQTYVSGPRAQQVRNENLLRMAKRAADDRPTDRLRGFAALLLRRDHESEKRHL